MRKRISLPRSAVSQILLLIVFGLGQSSPSAAQSPEKPFARRNSFGILTAYANNSSHILLGNAERRKLLDIGLSYSRRLIWGHVVDWQYDGEILPVALESDPLSKIVTVQTSPIPATFVTTGQPPPVLCNEAPAPYTFTAGGITYSGTSTTTCLGRQWTIGEAISPVGMQWNFTPRRKIQPLIEGHGGYMYSTHPIPIEFAGSFNFTFDFGAGFEWFRSHSQSVRAEYRYHHISNNETAVYNPGIDNGMFQLSYEFGR